jgi:hypothetical protein
MYMVASLGAFPYRSFSHGGPAMLTSIIMAAGLGLVLSNFFVAADAVRLAFF